MAIGSHKALLDQAAQLTPEEQLHLLDGLTAPVRQREVAATPPSIMDLEGLGQEVWRDPENGRAHRRPGVRESRALVVAWVHGLEGLVIAFDTAPLIYFIGANPTYSERVRSFFRAISAGRLHAVTSSVTLLEVLVQPIRRGNATLADQYREILLRTPSLAIVGLSESVAEEAATLRARYTVGFADAAQLATATTQNAAYFLTNDARLSRVTEARTLLLDDLS